MKYEVTKTDVGTNLLVKSEKLDSKLSPELKSLFINLISDPQSGGLIVDLKSIAFADSSGLSALLLAYRLYRDANRTLILHSLSERVQKLLEISQLSNVFTIADNEQEALSLLN